MAHVRESPPLRVTHDITTPTGRHYRWAQDDPDPASVPSGVSQSDTMPGGFENSGGVLPRKPGVDYADIERLSTWRTVGADGSVVWEGRLDSAPRSSGDRMAVSPAAVGYQAALEDDKSVSMVYIDRDASRWQPPSRGRRVALGAFGMNDPGVEADSTDGLPAVRLGFQGAWAVRPFCEAWYDAGAANVVSRVFYDPQLGPNVGAADTSWFLALFSADQDGGSATFTNASGDLLAGSAPTASQVDFATPQRYVMWQFADTDATGGTDGASYDVFIRRTGVYGNHGLTYRSYSAAEPWGFYASDIVTHAVQTWAPMLNTSIQQSSFVIPHLAFLDPTTAGEIVRQASRFDLPDWGVWENRTFWWTEQGANSRFWRARIGPSELEETGPSVDRLWESIVVQYQDVDGSTRTVGPPGSGADTESSSLKDSDPENPANKLGLIRRDLLQMGVSTAAGATEVGRRFLLESRLLDRSGKARAVGYIEDDRGVVHPYHAVRAGDYVTFVDASDKSYRRIIRTDKDHDQRTVSFDLDAPPEGLSQLLERLGVVLVPIGVGS